MVEVSRDGRRIYFTNSLYTPWDNQFYPDGVQGWMAKVDPGLAAGWSWTRTSSSKQGACGRTRSGWKVGTPRPTRTVTRKSRREDLMDWQAMVFLGAYHGINPGMGWLFAVALGMQQGSARGVWRALPPIALGHAAAVGLVVAIAGWRGSWCRSPR